MNAALRTLALVAYVVLLISPLAVIAYSLSPTAAFRIPPEGLSLRWFAGLFDQPRLVQGLFTSLLLGALSTGAAVAAGVPAALALTRGRLPGREALLAVLLSPLSLPGLVLGLGILTTVAAFGPALAGTLLPLAAAHLLVTIPWVVRSVAASLESTDHALEEQARSLGAGPLATLFLVTLPTARPGIVAGAVSAFVISFGNFALSFFLASGRTVTLPVAIFEAVDRYQDPTVAAISTLTILITGGTAAAAHRLAGGLQLPHPASARKVPTRRGTPAR